MINSHQALPTASLPPDCNPGLEHILQVFGPSGIWYVKINIGIGHTIIWSIYLLIIYFHASKTLVRLQHAAFPHETYCGIITVTSSS